AGQGHHLADADLEAVLVDAEGGDAGLQAGHLALVVGAPDVDDPVEAPDQELVAVVGDVAGQVGVVAALLGRLAQHPLAPGVAVGAGVEPDGAVLLPHEAALAQLLDGLLDGLALLDRRLAEPLVEVDVDGLELDLDEPQDVLGGPAPGLLDVLGAVVGAGQALDEAARVAALGQRPARPAGQDGLAEAADLPAGVVHVVLAGDLVAAALAQPAERVAVGGAPAVAGVDRPGRVGRDELDLDSLAVAEVVAGVALLALGDDLGQHLVEPGGRQVEVDEPGARDLDPLDV